MIFGLATFLLRTMILRKPVRLKILVASLF